MFPARGPACTLAVFTQLGRCFGQRFSKNAASVLVDPFGKAAQGQRPLAEVGEQGRRDLGVVIQHLDPC